MKVSDPFQPVVFQPPRQEQGHVFDEDVGGFQPEPLERISYDAADRVFRTDQQVIHFVNIPFLGHHFPDQAELEGSYIRRSVDRMLPVLFRQFARRQQIAHDLSQIDVDAGPYLIAEMQVHPEDIIRSEGFHFILFLVRLVGGIDTDKPVGIGPLRVFIQDRIQNIPVDFFRIVYPGRFFPDRPP